MSTALSTPPPRPKAVRPPPLENGDRLCRDEFERRYEVTPNLKRAELIDGVVYMAPPVSLGYHGSPHGDLMTWLGLYRAATPGVVAGDNSTVRVDDENEAQPDGQLLILPRCGGQAKLDEDGYVCGVPELAGEIASSSVSYDMHQKRELYRRAGVREYVVWRVYDAELDWFVLHEGEYRPLTPTDSILRSKVFPGLWLDPAALLAGDMAKVLSVLQQGIASAEHAQFAELLARSLK